MTPQRLPALDALRGWAIMAVFLVHTRLDAVLPPALGPLVTHGALGVGLFMVVSGFTVMYMWQNRANHHAPDSPAAFLFRRWMRVAPLYLLGLGVYQALAWATAGSWFPQATPTAIWGNLTLLNDWLPMAQNTGVPGGWSISAEVSFYLLFALVIPLLKRPVHMVGVFLAGTLVHGLCQHGALALFPETFKALPAGESDVFFRLWPPRQVPFFLMGATLAFALPLKPLRPYAKGLAWGGLITLGLIIAHPQHVVDESLAYALCFGALCIGLFHAPNRLLVNRVTTFLGRISYSLYIWHFLALALAKTLRDSLPPFFPTALTWGLFLAVAIPLAIAMATLSFTYIERPTQRWGKHILNKVKAKTP